MRYPDAPLATEPTVHDCRADSGEAHQIRRILMERDVVCGMQVDPAKAAGTSEYNNKTYYFCSKGCKTKFDTDPKQ